MDDFLALLDRRANGVIPGSGWGVYEVTCVCGYQYRAAAPIGTKGRFCPECKMYDPEFFWLEDDTGIFGEGSTLYPIGWERYDFNENLQKNS